jgi:SNF2 family DNA or RNA helicase
VHLLDDTRTTFAALWEGDYDVVLASYAAVMWQLRRLTKFWRFLHILRHCGRNAAEQAAKDEGLPTRRPTVPLFTSLLYLLPFRITTKILDEAHKLKKWDGKQRQAVESIPTAYVDLMTGTPCGNVWHDILSICALLPKEPFKTRAEYLKVFTSNSVSRVEAAKAPTAVDIINLARYLLPFTFGRTIDQLELKGVTHEPPTTFSISESQSELTLYLIESFIRIARMGKEEKDLNEDEIKSAMGFCTRAEQESGFPVLATYTAKQQDAMKKKAINLQDARKKFVQAVGEAKKIARSLDDADNQTARRLPGWADLDELQTGTTKFTEAMTRWLIECGFQQLLFLSLSAVTSAEDASNEATEEEIEDDTVEFTVPMDGEITNTTPIKNNKAKGENVKGNAKHTAFLEDVKNMADCDIFTPRCEAFLRLYEDILRTHPGEKILLWSRFYKGLVLVAEALRRRHGIQMPIYSGLLDTTARDTMIGRWESAALTDSKTPMAVQAKAGGTGLTLNAASQVVFLEVSRKSKEFLRCTH